MSTLGYFRHKRFHTLWKSIYTIIHGTLDVSLFQKGKNKREKGPSLLISINGLFHRQTTNVKGHREVVNV